jgi:hypothetical protein
LARHSGQGKADDEQHASRGDNRHVPDEAVLDFFVDRLEVHAPPPPVVITVPGRAGETTAVGGEAWAAPTGVAVSAE